MLAKKKGAVLLIWLLAAWLWAPVGALAVQVGQKAPDFKLPATTGKAISLSQYKGKSLVLVEFYVADFGPT